MRTKISAARKKNGPGSKMARFASLTFLAAFIILPFTSRGEIYARSSETALSEKAEIQLLRVTGYVYEAETGEPLPGVNVTLEGTTRGVITDGNGRFVLDNIESGSVLNISYIGYLTQRVTVDGTDELRIDLVQDVETLDEVVVIGYGTVKKADMTGAVSTIETDKLSINASANITDMIQGRAPGLMIHQQSAQPGGGLNILIRGQASTNANNEPLYVIDGFPIAPSGSFEEPRAGKYSSGTRNPLNSINPNDIESIQVLKDASATSIYGARAQNGVILITTKRGSKGVKVSVDSKVTMQNMLDYQQMLNAEEWMQYKDIYLEMYNLANRRYYPFGDRDPGTWVYEPEYTEADYERIGTGTDWMEEVTRTGYIVDQNLTISGGDDKTKYFSSFNYFDHQGVVENSDLTRYSGRLNLDQQITDRIKFGMNTTASQIRNNNAALGASHWEHIGMIGSALTMPPIFPVLDSTGNYSVNEFYDAQPNPVSYKELDDYTVERRFLTNVYAEIELFKGLKFRPSYGFDTYTSKRSSYMPNTFMYGKAYGGVAEQGSSTANTNLYEATLNYLNIFNEKHMVNVVAGASAEKRVNEGFTTDVRDFFTDKFSANNMSVGTNRYYSGSWKNQVTFASFFGRLIYSYQSKYLLTLTGRADGSDRFGINNKWAFFPSAAVGWNIAKEQFMDQQDLVNDLKIRLSAGQTGNASIGANAFAYFGSGGFSYQFDDVLYSGMGKTQVANPYLRWETTTEFNSGIDFGFLRNRIYGSIEVYYKEVKDLLDEVDLQIYMPVDDVAWNIGVTQSHGYEFSLNVNLISKPDLQWSVNLNGSQFIDRWKVRAPEQLENLNDWEKVRDYKSALYSYVPDHIFQIGEEQTLILPGDQQYIPGALVVKDLDGWLRNESGDLVFDEEGNRILVGAPDGRIDEADQVLRGTRDPNFIYGFGTNFSYKGFELSMFFNGMLNYWIENEHMIMHVLKTFDIGAFNRGIEYRDVWTIYNQEGTIPLAISGKRMSDVGIESPRFQEISYLKLKTLRLGYGIPKPVLGARVKVYVDGTNLFTLTNLENMDPETVLWRDFSENWSTSATGLYAYPSTRSFTFGLTANF